MTPPDRRIFQLIRAPILRDELHVIASYPIAAASRRNRPCHETFVDFGQLLVAQNILARLGSRTLISAAMQFRHNSGYDAESLRSALVTHLSGVSKRQ